MRLTANFTLSELIKSGTAERLGIDNYPTQPYIDRLRALAENVLQPLRDHYGVPVTITSGYRSTELNAAIGGSPSSQHRQGEAADLEIWGVSNAEAAQWIAENCEFDQLILEFHDYQDPNSGWIHVSYTAERPNRGEMLFAEKVDGRTQYSLVESFV